jgi:hypothetical protein
MKITLLFLSTIFAVCGVVYAVDASSLGNTSIDEVNITISPEFPAPYEKVNVQLESFSFDINTAVIEWSVSGKVFSSGLGIKSITITTGGVGETIPVSAKVKTGGGNSLLVSASITPQSVDLLWESPESYVPAFYEGKSLPGEGSTVRVVALPTMGEGGKQIPANAISYSWYVDGDFIESASGLGKQAGTFKLNYLSNKTNIEVLARSGSGITATKKIDIYTHAVMPLLYIYDELLGPTQDRLVMRRFETTEDFTLSLEPYYLSANGSLSSSALYEWYLNALPATSEQDRLISFRTSANSSGSRKLSVVLSNTKRKLQNAQADLEILFDTRR